MPCFVLLPRLIIQPASTTLLCSYWTYGIRVIFFPVTARITIKTSTPKPTKKHPQHINHITLHHSWATAAAQSSQLSEVCRPAYQIPTITSRKPFLITRARTTTMEPELERSSIAKGNGVGLGKTGRRAGFAEGSVLLLVLESILANFSSPPSLLQESRIYPHLLRSYFTCGFLDFFGLPDLFFPYHPTLLCRF